MAHSAPHSLAAAAGFVSPALSQRAVTLAIIIAFHVVLVYLLASGLGATTMKIILQPIEGSLLEEVKQPDQPPPPPDPVLQQAREPDLGPVPDINVGTEDFGPSTAITGTATTEVPVAPVTPARVEPLHLVGKHQLPNTEDYYPPSLRRLGVEGATSINVCVDERGKRTGEPTVMESSGNARLDEGALAVARAGRYARSARGETFVPSCYGFRIIFKMN